VTTAKFINEEDIFYFQKQLLKWYSENGRTFPWRRKSVTNYELIIAEVFLQRTKAETVAKYLPKFLKIYPSWKQLANATEFELREILKPLGLNKQRGNRLYKLAQDMNLRNGRFPLLKNEVEDMPMMGQYITNAYELYVLKKKSPLLDVNMARLLERFFRERKLKDIRHDPYLQTLAYRVVNIIESKELNWAILDFASMICRTKPLCNKCIFVEKCNYYKNVQTV
jgi:A/G-specific adenine glycosylase